MSRATKFKCRSPDLYMVTNSHGWVKSVTKIHTSWLMGKKYAFM
jgi:hypothetical protein